MADQTKRIIYKQDNGVIAIIIPAINEKRSIEEIASKDVSQSRSSTPSVNSLSAIVHASLKVLSVDISDTLTILYALPVGTSLLAISSIDLFH